MTEAGATVRDEEELVSAWRESQLVRLGVAPETAAELAATIDAHALAALLDRGCPVSLAIEILR